MTLTPLIFSSSTTTVPTPPAAADTTTVSPGPADTARTAAYAVTATTYIEPATGQETPAGLRMSWPAGTATYSAWLERLPDQPSTSSPTENSVTPSPTALTTPARSLPSPDGKVAGNTESR